MKKVTLKTLTLINFKGIKNLTVNFGQVTEICGANATGKSTVADAFNWVLFGKDTAGNSDSKFGIKTNDGTGKAIPKLEHEVTAVLDVDGQPVELRRVLAEDWVTPRGKAEPELKGNSTAYFFNGVPLKESEYKAKINEIINEDLFRMITNPLYFPRLDWQVQREMLLRIAGGITLEEIAKDRAEFSELLSQLSGKNLAEYRAEISARKKKVEEALKSIPTRIDEVARATPNAPDYKALDDEKTDIEKEIQQIETAMKHVVEASKQKYEAQRKIQDEINELKNTQQQILFDAREKAKEEWNNSNAAAKYARSKFDSVKREAETTMQMMTREINAFNSNLEQAENGLKNLATQIESKRALWTIENSKEYNPSASELCPNCGYDLKKQQNEDAKAKFEQSKSDSLKSISAEGKKLAQQKADLEKDIEEIKKGIEKVEGIIENAKKDYDLQLSTLQKEINANPQSSYTEPTSAELPEYANLETKITILSNSLKDSQISDGDGNSERRKWKRELKTRLEAINQQFALKNVIENNENRRAELLQEEKKLAQQKADLEKQEFTADSLVKEQMNEVERCVNRRFNLVQFKMFAQQINGCEKPDCILISRATGAKFLDTNNADKINIGLDIINTLCEFNGFCAPIFIDNAEGINQLLPVDSQLVKLIVTLDNELIIK